MKSLLFLFLFGFSFVCLAQKTITTDALLTHASIYYGRGAELEHTAKPTLLAGSQELIINNISQSVDVNTIQVACPEDVSILSYRFNLLVKKPEPVVDPIISLMQDSIRQLTKQVATIDNDYYTQNEVLVKTTAIIEANAGNPPERTISAAELIKLMDYYGGKIQNIKMAMFSLTQKKEIISDSIQHINTRIAERNKTIVQPATKMIGQLIMQVIAKTAGSAHFSLTYYTQHAGWLPAYDLRVKSIDNSFKLVYKASVHQSTGIDWKQVKLSLSTRNPNQSTASPVLNPWFVSLYVPQMTTALNETVVTGYGAGKKSLFLKDVAGNYEAVTDEEFKQEAAAVEGNLVQAYTSLSESQLNVNFDIDLPYDIASDGKAVNVGIKDEIIKAGYKHYAAPKLDRDAFLVAEIRDWESLNLMPGVANIIMDNVYLGKSFIDPNSTADTLSVALGRDKRIAVTRTLVKEFSKSKIKGDNKTEAFTYEIVVKNNKTKAVDLVLSDQIPVSKIKEVEVAVTDNGQAEVNDETGILQWKIKLEPGESRKFRFGYAITYPKDKKIRNL